VMLQRSAMDGAGLLPGFVPAAAEPRAVLAMRAPSATWTGTPRPHGRFDAGEGARSTGYVPPGKAGGTSGTENPARMMWRNLCSCCRALPISASASMLHRGQVAVFRESRSIASADDRCAFRKASCHESGGRRDRNS
jgi:hypothetical protein